MLRAESLEDALTEAHLANINALLIFTSQDALSSGLYHFTKIGADMEIYNLPFIYNLSGEGDINYFISGNIGYSRVFASEDIHITSEKILSYDNHIRTYTAGLGGGIRYSFSKLLHFLGGAEFIYSRSGTSVKGKNDDASSAVEDFFNQSYNDNFSYKIFMQAEYRAEFALFKPYYILSYKFFDTKSDFSFGSFSRFRSQSNVFSSSLGFETNELYRYGANYLTLEAYFNANYLNGAVVDSTQVNGYSKVGSTLYWYTEGSPEWAKRFFIELSTINTYGLEAYNLGLGFTLNY